MDQAQPLRTGDMLDANPTLLHCVVEVRALFSSLRLARNQKRR